MTVCEILRGDAPVLRRLLLAERQWLRVEAALGPTVAMQIWLRVVRIYRLAGGRPLNFLLLAEERGLLTRALKGDSDG